MVTASEILSSLEMVLGGICPAPRAISTSRLLEISVSGGIAEKLLLHWASLPAGSRPRLRGLAVSREAASSRRLLLEIGARAPLLLVSVESSWSGRSVTSLWPYAAWWEAELAGFENISFPGGSGPKGVAWQPV